MLRNYRSPLVLLTPKSLLRLPRATSSVNGLSRGRFHRLIDDAATAGRAEAVRRVLLCSGKVYYDLLERQEQLAGSSPPPVALVRLEQLYPWPEEDLCAVLERYDQAEEVVWVQEEPANMGAWTFVRERIQGALRPGSRLSYAGRRESASTATGSLRRHRQEQRELIDSAFDRLNG